MAEKTLGQVAYDACTYNNEGHVADWDRIADAVVAAHEARRWNTWPDELAALYWRRLAHAINHATPYQQAEAMTRLTPGQEEIARRFEDAGK